MKIIIQNSEKFGAKVFLGKIKNKLCLLSKRYPQIKSVDISFGEQSNFSGIKKSCRLKLKTSESKFLISCFDETIEKSIDSAFEVLAFQLENVIDSVVA